MRATPLPLRLPPLMLLLLPLTACWSPRYFAPREHASAAGPEGDPAALYAVPADGIPRGGEVRVWSSGAHARFTDDDREIVELHVGFEVENNTTQPMYLDVASVVCEALSIGGVQQATLSPQRFTGDGDAPPRTTARIDFVFETAADTPSAVDCFAVRFVVRAGDRDALVQVTPFGPYERYYPYPDYDPYWWGMGFGVGWSWSYCHH